MFDTLEITDPEAVVRAHDCAAYDWHGQRHVHCSVDGALVNVTTDGDGINEIEDGARCPKCTLIACADCLTDNTPNGETWCTVCAGAALAKLQDDDEFELAPHRAAKDLALYAERLRTERDPARIRATLGELHKVHDVLETIMAALPREIERAYGLQQRLPEVA